MLPELDIALRHGTDGLQRMYLNGEDVTEQIRQPEISLYASDVSAIPAVRAFLMDMQRDMARRYDVVMDGRDIGTVVLPSAGLKVFLTAAPEVRAERGFGNCGRRGPASRWRRYFGTFNTGMRTTAAGLPPPCARQRMRLSWTRRLWISRPAVRLWPAWWRRNLDYEDGYLV